ncbi:hypothetical protein SBA7_520041 [Candidatus Sulfotelmatobacter sp. SbA7]|nr:hypothetical protein SBA7_520041 [Candidatus Sulfotelmatobacter sp. SbA7]
MQEKEANQRQNTHNMHLAGLTNRSI